MEFIFIEGEAKPQMLYTPYVHTRIVEYSTFYKIYSNNLLSIVKKENVGGKKKK